MSNLSIKDQQCVSSDQKHTQSAPGEVEDALQNEKGKILKERDEVFFLLARRLESKWSLTCEEHDETTYIAA